MNVLHARFGDVPPPALNGGPADVRDADVQGFIRRGRWTAGLRRDRATRSASDSFNVLLYAGGFRHLLGHYNSDRGDADHTLCCGGCARLPQIIAAVEHCAFRKVGAEAPGWCRRWRLMTSRHGAAATGTAEESTPAPVRTWQLSCQQRLLPAISWTETPVAGDGTPSSTERPSSRGVKSGLKEFNLVAAQPSRTYHQPTFPTSPVLSIPWPTPS